MHTIYSPEELLMPTFNDLPGKYFLIDTIFLTFLYFFALSNVLSSLQLSTIITS